METFYFTLGVLSIIAIIFIVALVWGLVKVVRTKKDLEDFKVSYGWDGESNRRNDEILRREIHNMNENVHRRIEEVYQESKSHTDKRADKLIQVIDGFKS
jgi:uncharacterized protein HemY